MVQSPRRKEKIQPNLRRVDTTKHTAQKKNSTPNASASPKTKSPKGLPKLKPGKVILATFILGIIGFTYLTHVFATQALLEEVQQLEQEYNLTRQLHDELRLRYDRMVGPAEIYQKAKEQGFVNGGAADKVIEVNR